MANTGTLPPLSLYIHIPWCVRKCPYCDFNSHSQSDISTELEASYIEALKRDLQSEIPFVKGRKLQSIFIGGGTPSLMSGQSLKDLLYFVETTVGFDKDIEITLEANPGTAEQKRFSDYRKAGVNRLSIGVQSFNDLSLQQLGRIHSSENAKTAFHMARQTGFDNINLDLMHGLPNQSPQDALRDLQAAISLKPNHLSWYQLTIEPNTAFYNSPPVLPEDEILAEIFEQGQTLLAENGYNQYEISAYSQSDKQSKHNLNYWQFGDYLAIGAGAHGKYTTDAGIVRRSKTRQPDAYLARENDFCADSFQVSDTELPLEFMMNALRLTKGTLTEYYSQRTGLLLEDIAPILSELEQQGLLEPFKHKIKTTPNGLLFLNNILERFDG